MELVLRLRGRGPVPELMAMVLREITMIYENKWLRRVVIAAMLTVIGYGLCQIYRGDQIEQQQMLNAPTQCWVNHG
jgi:hypothetical protein